MKKLAAFVLMLSLSGCGCALDSGDSTEFGKYISGCWEAAKGNHDVPDAPPATGYREKIPPYTKAKEDEIK